MEEENLIEGVHKLISLKYREHNGMKFYYWESDVQSHAVSNFGEKKIVTEGKLTASLIFSNKFDKEVQINILSPKGEITEVTRNNSAWNRLEINFNPSILKDLRSALDDMQNMVDKEIKPKSEIQRTLPQ
jgi:hypothetical protein